MLQAKLEEVKKLYADQIKDLEAMKVTRPAKPVAAEKVRFGGNVKRVTRDKIALEYRLMQD